MTSSLRMVIRLQIDMDNVKQSLPKHMKSNPDKILEHIRDYFGFLVSEYGFSVKEKWDTKKCVEFEKSPVMILLARYWDGIVLVYISLIDPASQLPQSSHDLNNIVWYQLYKQGVPSENMERIYRYHHKEEEDVSKLAQMLKRYGAPYLEGDFSIEQDLMRFEKRLMENEAG